MKQIIISITICLFILGGQAQTNASEQLVKNEVTAFAFKTSSFVGEGNKQEQFAHVRNADSITVRVLKNKEGQTIRMLRYYTAIELLPIHLRTRFAERFNGYVPTAVIEDHDVRGVRYVINLTQGSRWLQVHSRANGRIYFFHRYYNSLLEANRND